MSVSTTSGREQIATLFAVVPAAIIGAVAVPAFAKARGQAVSAGCVSNLRMIDAAKQMWALDQGLDEGEMPSPDGMETYFQGGLPTCPEGGAYPLGSIGTPPSCSIHGTAEDF